MVLYTVSAVVSFYERLEEEAAKFYEELASNERYSEGKGIFLGPRQGR